LWTNPTGFFFISPVITLASLGGGDLKTKIEITGNNMPSSVMKLWMVQADGSLMQIYDIHSIKRLGTR